jgi:hypothetical protein
MSELAVWGQQEEALFNNGREIEFILHADDSIRVGDTMDIRFFNANGHLSESLGKVSHVEPGLIKIEKA